MKWATPRLYENQFRVDFEHMVTTLVNDISDTEVEELKFLISEFAYVHHADVVLEKGQLEIIANFHDWEVADNREILHFSRTEIHQMTGEVFSLQVISSTRPITTALGIMFRVWHWLLSVFLIISIVVSFFYVHFLAKPIIEISLMSEKIKALNLKERSRTKRTDEIGILARNLNTMAELLDETLIDLQSTNLSLQEKIEKEQELEKQRNDFLMAISHELKTPLTVLMTYLDGMIAGFGDFQDKTLYLSKARQTTLSMNDLVGQLLAIISLQSREKEVLKEKVEVGLLLEEVCKNYEELADSYHVSLTTFCEKGIIVNANKMQLKTAISNILSNGIIHREKGRLVDIQLENKDEKAFLTIKNFGTSISEEDLPHLFNLFYRADKSRNKRTGGSGLGLYIVKCILELHEFSYGIENDENGVVFWIDFQSNRN